MENVNYEYIGNLSEEEKATIDRIALQISAELTLKKDMTYYFNEEWLHIVNKNATENSEKVKIESEKEGQGSLGKYMFFSEKFEELVAVGIRILRKYKLWQCKVSLVAGGSGIYSYVLCVYDYWKRYDKEMGAMGPNYRHWKSNRDTKQGKYSEQYLKTKEAVK